MLFAPAHDRFTSKTAICPHDNPHSAAKTLANGRHDLLKGFNGPLARIAFAISQLGQKRNITAKTVQRQVAVANSVMVFCIHAIRTVSHSLVEQLLYPHRLWRKLCRILIFENLIDL